MDHRLMVYGEEAMLAVGANQNHCYGASTSRYKYLHDTITR